MSEAVIDKSINAPSTYLCTGCSVCKVACPVEGCIFLDLNQDGYIEAIANPDTCTQCGKCQTSCYKYHDIHPFDFNDSITSYLATNRDMDIRYKSSSGGIGTALCRAAIEEGYIVIGATFAIEEGKVKHIEISSVDELHKIRGSKYFFSFCYEAFQKIEKNRKYLIIGTPCQISGLKEYFGERAAYSDIITVDFRCFGCAGYNLLERYSDYLEDEINDSGIKSINMRSKEINWHRWGVSIDFNDGKHYFRDKFTDLFAIAFRSGQATHKVCQTCTLYQSNTSADIRMEDAWAFVQEQEDEELKKGVSQVGIFSEKGRWLFEKTKKYLSTQEVEYDYSVPRVRQLSDNTLFMESLRDPSKPLSKTIAAYLRSHPKEKRTLVWQYLNTLDYYKKFVRHWPKRAKDIFISIVVFLKMDLKWFIKDIVGIFR